MDDARSFANGNGPAKPVKNWEQREVLTLRESVWKYLEPSLYP